MVAAVALLLWVATAYKVVELHRHPSPAQRSLTLTVGCLAVAATFFVPVIHELTGEVTGVSNLAEPLARSAVLVAACGAQVLLLRLTAPDGVARGPVARRGVAAALVVLVLWSLFLAAPDAEPTLRSVSDFSDGVSVVAYLGLALGYLAWALVDIGRGCRRYSAEASGHLAVGLRQIAWGCLAGQAYIAVKVAVLVSVAIGLPIPLEVELTLARSLAVVAGTLVIIGTTLPATGPWVSSLKLWLAAYRDHHRLYPLWADLISVTPAIALDPAGSRLQDALRVRDLDMRVYRRVIEIRDGRLALRPFLDATLASDVDPSVAPQEAAAAAEASMLRAAVTSARSNQAPARVAEGRGSAGESFADELSWFLDVACYYTGRTPAGLTPLRNRSTQSSARAS